MNVRVVRSDPQPTGFIVGVDLGQSKDFTAIVVNERKVSTERTYERGPFESVEREIECREVVMHDLLWLHRAQLGTPYPKIINQAQAILSDLPQRREPPELVCDSTGVGRPVIDMFRDAGLDPIGITITGGADVNRVKRNDIRVPKRVLASILQVVLQTGRLRIARSLPNVQTLIAELENFKVKVSASGAETFEAWRESVHDDLVLATALAVWQAENRPAPVHVEEASWFFAR